MASFSDDRCGADGVCSSDPLTFTCEINGVAVLQVVLPISEPEIVSHLHTREGLNEDLPDGFTAVTLNITEIDNSSRDFVLTLSITNASLLAGGEIRCDDATGNNVAMAGCPVLGKSCKQSCFQASAISTSLYVWTQGHPSCVSVHGNVYCTQEYQSCCALITAFLQPHPLPLTQDSY